MTSMMDPVTVVRSPSTYKVFAVLLAAVSTKYPKAATEVGPRAAATPVIGELVVAPVEQVNAVVVAPPAGMSTAPVTVEPQAETTGLRVLTSTVIKARLVVSATAEVEIRVRAVETLVVEVMLMNPPANPKDPIPPMVAPARVETVVEVTVEEPTVRAEVESPEIVPEVVVMEVVVMVVEVVMEIAAVPDMRNALLTVTVVEEVRLTVAAAKLASPVTAILEPAASNVESPSAENPLSRAKEEPSMEVAAPSSVRLPAVMLLLLATVRLLPVTFRPALTSTVALSVSNWEPSETIISPTAMEQPRRARIREPPRQPHRPPPRQVEPVSRSRVPAFSMEVSSVCSMIAPAETVKDNWTVRETLKETVRLDITVNAAAGPKVRPPETSLATELNEKS